MQQLNPIEQRMVSGMSAIAAFLTEATCGEACWHAREEVCRCSCGGKNHGCLRDASGEQPIRTAKIDGRRYELRAVGRTGLYDEAERINKAAGPYQISGSYKYYYCETDKGAPARIKPATKAQFEKWPELKAARDEYNAKKAVSECFAQYMNLWPYLLWVKVAE